ncbi:MAG: sulfite exporter TauE/SafE family protein [Proteobacteria bacterium]|nr:sulfite exporter TauE/SafE family protein [Pseudomonadota bacterium]NCA27998.1 sulfite exporter TauE/SafE family protein [Pseudomonadota bacterium]
MNSQDLLIIFSLASMGFFGGFTHCMSMCGPFVLTQVTSNLSRIKIAEYNGFNKITKIALIPYHLGRITTYSLLGFAISSLRISIDNSIGFEIISGILLFFAMMFFVNLLINQNEHFFNKYFDFKKYFTRKINDKISNRFSKKLKKFFTNIFSKIVIKINFLLNNSLSWRGYLLGLILGFIPCGMLYGAFALTASFSSAFYAIFGMIIFGLSTFIALFVVGFFARLTLQISEFKIIANIVILINIYVLFKILLDRFF